jgi:hypothetical protein
VTLAVSTFLPWVVVGGVPKRGVPEMAALWVLGLGILSAVLATLSLITRKNSRHPLLVLGLTSLGITYLSWRILPRLAREHALTVAQAFAIVEGRTLDMPPTAFAGSGLYVGLAASTVIALFGLTIVIRRASTPYVVADPNDDV